MHLLSIIDSVNFKHLYWDFKELWCRKQQFLISLKPTPGDVYAVHTHLIFLRKEYSVSNCCSDNSCITSSFIWFCSCWVSAAVSSLEKVVTLKIKKNQKLPNINQSISDLPTENVTLYVCMCAFGEFSRTIYVSPYVMNVSFT